MGERFGNPGLRVNVAELLRRPGTQKQISTVLSLKEPIVFQDVRVPESSDVAIDVVIESLSDGATVNGSVSTAWVGLCVRCLGDAGQRVAADVNELYQFKPTTEEAFELVGEQIDLEPMAMQLVMLELPIAPLCRPECAGLCPECGANRNEVTCSCERAPVDHRWQALESLRDQFPE